MYIKQEPFPDAPEPSASRQVSIHVLIASILLIDLFLSFLSLKSPIM